MEKKEKANEITQNAMNNKVTLVYGYSDDWIEFEGLIYDEVGAWEETKHFTFEDGTEIEVKYGDENNKGIWKIKVTKTGSANSYMIECFDEEDDLYSDLFVIECGGVK